MPEVNLLKKKSYVAMIRNAVRGETHLFRNVFAHVDGVEQDILRDGQVSCAVFVSSLLMLNGLLDRPHATVSGTEKAMEAAGWKQVDSGPVAGAVLTWSPVTFSDGATHSHIGFSVGEGRAVSNASNSTGIPAEHSDTYDNTRAIERVWWHPTLDEV